MLSPNCLLVRKCGKRIKKLSGRVWFFKNFLATRLPGCHTFCSSAPNLPPTWRILGPLNPLIWWQQLNYKLLGWKICWKNMENLIHLGIQGGSNFSKLLYTILQYLHWKWVPEAQINFWCVSDYFVVWYPKYTGCLKKRYNVFWLYISDNMLRQRAMLARLFGISNCLKAIHACWDMSKTI